MVAKPRRDGRAQRAGIQRVELGAPRPFDAHDARLFQHVEMLRHRLPRQRRPVLGEEMGADFEQRLARAGFRTVGIEAGPFWDTERDWVSDEVGSSKLYWNALRITGGSDPITLGANNSGHGVGGVSGRGRCGSADHGRGGRRRDDAGPQDGAPRQRR